MGKPDGAKKRRLQFGLRTLLFGMTVAVAVVFWWITWPQRRADRFVYLMGTAPDKAEEISRLGGMGAVLRKYKHGSPYLEPHSRSLAEVLSSTQTFTVVVQVYDRKLDGQEMEITATLFCERGKLRGPIELDSRPTRQQD